MKSHVYLVFFCFASSFFSDIVVCYGNDVYDSDLACPYERVCLPINYCPGLDVLMHRKAIAPQRFRIAVCGYQGVTAKVCCGLPRESNTRRSISSFECGTSTISNNIPSVTLGSFPFLARIGFINANTGETKYACIGTIIDTRTVLTTASCALARRDNYKLQTVLVGEYDTATDLDCNQMFCGPKPPCLKISYVVKHPGYDSNTAANNIALIRLEQPIIFSAMIQPACLYSGREFNIRDADELSVFGWGKVSGELSKRDRIFACSKTTRSSPTTLRSIPVRLLPRRDCNDFTNRGLRVELCAIGEREPCAGFSGSPLIRMNRNKYTVIGLLSYGSTCEDNRNSPLAFVDIQLYADWIAQN